MAKISLGVAFILWPKRALSSNTVTLGIMADIDKLGPHESWSSDNLERNDHFMAVLSLSILVVFV